MVAKVARAFGPSFEAIWSQRYDCTLLAYLSLLDLERLDGAIAKHALLDSAVLTSLGVLKGSALKQAVDAFERSLQRGPRTAERAGFDLSPFLTFPGMPHYKGPKS